MAKRGKERRKNTVSCDDAEFFKVFLPHLNSHQLMIPPDFIKDFSRTIKEKVILKDIGGKIWHVDVERTRDGVFLKKGWQSFVTHQCLMVGDFLVFRYDGAYSFIVKIFGRNGCKKEALASKIIDAHVKVEKNTEEEIIEAKQTFCKRARPHQENHPLMGSEELNELKEQNAAAKLPENCKDVEPTDSVLTKCPSFVTCISHSRRYNVEIPKEVQHNIRYMPNMVLRNENGREWPVQVYTMRDKRVMIGTGWSAFHRDNNLGLNDGCRFTFESRIVHVQILRAKSDILHKRRRC